MRMVDTEAILKIISAADVIIAVEKDCWSRAKKVELNRGAARIPSFPEPALAGQMRQRNNIYIMSHLLLHARSNGRKNCIINVVSFELLQIYDRYGLSGCPLSTGIMCRKTSKKAASL